MKYFFTVGIIFVFKEDPRKPTEMYEKPFELRKKVENHFEQHAHNCS